ncbi:surfeit locus protein 1 isoform X1 [Lycorma delicatula]|uniref:surfeit locus protein 1 isoform X1 n=1 Tax=Lycorma delicatula TaxID=130591 RepID=UPI003F50E2E4
MWKNVKSSKWYLAIQNDIINEVICFVKVKPVKISNIRHQSTKHSKYVSHTLAKPPPPQYIQYTQQNKPKNRISLGELLLLTVPIGTFGLGTWQVKRREWKLNLIKDLEKRLSEPPIDLPEDLAELSSLEYRKVKVEGKFDHSNELYLGPRMLLSGGESVAKSGLLSVGAKKNVGHHVVTPFILSDSGKRILVNRGWVPTAMLNANKRLEGQIEDEVELVGIVRLHEERSTFMPSNQPQIRVYHYRDLKKMAKKTNTLRVFLDACEESTVPGGPIGGQTNVSLRNEHMSYIITWYSLSALTAFLWCKKFLFR